MQEQRLCAGVVQSLIQCMPVAANVMAAGTQARTASVPALLVQEHRLCAGDVQSLIQCMSVAANVMAVQVVAGARFSANVSKFTVYW